MKSLFDFAKMTDIQAIDYLESLRWPDGAECTHCKSKSVYRLLGQCTRIGLYKCKKCLKQFRVTMGTMYEGSHLSVQKWLCITYLICTAKKGISAKQISREMGIGYKTAWKVAHRIRVSLRTFPKDFKGDVEMDETYVGGYKEWRKFGTSTAKCCIVAIIERMGKARTFVLRRSPNKKALHTLAKRYIKKESTFMTDDLHLYRGLKFDGGHHVVKHSKKEYVRGEAHTNTAESYFSLIKRSLRGTYHSISKKHVRKYLNEFEFRWNLRKIEDELLMRIAVKFGLN